MDQSNTEREQIETASDLDQLDRLTRGGGMINERGLHFKGRKQVQLRKYDALNPGASTF